MKDEILQFLSKLPPFTSLPEEELQRVADHASEKTYPKKTILSVQGRTTLDHVYLIKEGSLELFYETEDERTGRRRNLSGWLQ